MKMHLESAEIVNRLQFHSCFLFYQEWPKWFRWPKCIPKGPLCNMEWIYSDFLLEWKHQTQSPSVWHQQKRGGPSGELTPAKLLDAITSRDRCWGAVHTSSQRCWWTFFITSLKQEAVPTCLKTPFWSLKTSTATGLNDYFSLYSVIYLYIFFAFYTFYWSVIGLHRDQSYPFRFTSTLHVLKDNKAPWIPWKK